VLLLAAALAASAGGAVRAWGAACPVPVADCNSNGLEDAFDPDCNSNGVPDACEVLDDCNADGVPDVCEPPAARARTAATGLLDCLAGPGVMPPATARSGCACEAFYDLDGDSDVDLADYALMQRAQPVAAQRWWNPHWPYRMPVTVGAAGYARSDLPVEVAVDFSAALASLGASGAFDPATLRVIEVDAGGAVLDERTVFQFDAAPDYDATSNAVGTLVVQLAGVTPADAERRFEVYFAKAGAGLPAACFDAEVNASDGVAHEGQDAVEIETAIGTWYYQKVGAGFASLDDVDGQDWIGYHPGGGPNGEYRGIPNAGPFHPGYLECTSTLESAGPLRARIRSVSTNGLWACTWDVYPRFATLTILQVAEPYWFLYEGTPYGALDKDRDFVVRSDGTNTPVTQTWSGDIPAPEWLYFGDGATERMLYVAHHGDDDASDQFWQMQGAMTVFGFGRQYPCCDTYLTAVPDRFTVGLAEVADYAAAVPLVDGVWRDVAVSVGAAETLAP